MKSSSILAGRVVSIPGASTGSAKLLKRKNLDEMFFFLHSPKRILDACSGREHRFRRVDRSCAVIENEVCREGRKLPSIFAVTGHFFSYEMTMEQIRKVLKAATAWQKIADSDALGLQRFVTLSHEKPFFKPS